MGARHSLASSVLAPTSGSGTTVVASGSWPGQGQFPDSSGMLFSYLQADGWPFVSSGYLPDCQMEIGPIEDLE